MACSSANPSCSWRLGWQGAMRCCAQAGRSWPGMALGALVLKPQLAFLVPAALLVSGRYRAFGASVVTIGLLALVAVLAVGPGGVSEYEQRLSFAAGVPVNRELTIAPIVGSLIV